MRSSLLAGIPAIAGWAPVPQIITVTRHQPHLTSLEGTLAIWGLSVAAGGILLCMLTTLWLRASDRRRALMAREVREALDGSRD